MATTRAEIRQWLEEGKAKKATHMIVVCDTYDHEDYPVYVSAAEDVHEVYKANNGPNMTRAMEVYSYGHDLETQLAEFRAFHFD